MPSSRKAKKRKPKKTHIAWAKASKARKIVVKATHGVKGHRLKYRLKQKGTKGGRYTYYHPKYCKEVIALGKSGKSPTQIAAHFGIARSTLNQRWRKDHPDFKEAFDLAMTHAQAYWECALAERISSNSRGGGPAVTALTFMLARRFREDYKDMKDISSARTTMLIPMSESLSTKDKVKAYLDAVKGGVADGDDL